MKKGRSLNGPRVYKKMHRLNDKISVEKRKKEYNAGMKFIHLADLHIGKRVNEFSMIDDQKFIFQQILRIIEEEKPDGGVILAGDLYDKSVPSAEAVELLDEFLVALAERKVRVFAISGNHDSAERIAFGNRLMDRSGIYLSPVYSGKIEPVTLEERTEEVSDAGLHPPVDIWMLPFIKPQLVRHLFPEEEVQSYTDAMRVAISHMNLRKDHRNLLITHQFVTGASHCDSEEISIGGTDNVDAEVFAPFDYVALGHLHGPQNIHFGGKTVSEKTEGETVPENHVETVVEKSPEIGQKAMEENAEDTKLQGPVIRYSGTPLKYSFSEVNHKKSVTIVEIGEKNREDHALITLRTVPLKPLHDLREIRGSYDEVMSRAFYSRFDPEDYMHVTLTDELDVPDAMGKLRTVYHNLMKLDYDNARTRNSMEETGELSDMEKKSPMELFQELYRKQNHQDMSEEQKTFLKEMMEGIWEDAE